LAALPGVLEGKDPQHTRIEESPEASKGTLFDEEILANPPEGKAKQPAMRSDEL